MSKTPTTFKEMLKKTKDAFVEPWDIADLNVTPDTMAFISLMHSLLTLSFGINLIIHGVLDPIGPLVFFASLIGIPVWGWLIVLALLVFLIGFFLRKSLPITIGALLCSSVWVGLALCTLFGVIALGDGWRFFVPVFYITAMWIVFFYLQLKRNRPNGD